MALLTIVMLIERLLPARLISTAWTPPFGMICDQRQAQGLDAGLRGLHVNDRQTFRRAPRAVTTFDARFDTRALSTAHRRSNKLGDRDTQLRCHGGQIEDTNGRWSYPSRVMPRLMQAPILFAETG